MKKFYALVFATVFAFQFTNAQCTVDPSAQTTQGVNPGPAQLPCIVVGVACDQTIQGKIQQSYDTTVLTVYPVHVDVDSVRMDSIVGLPAGINWTKSPDVLLGGGNGCVKFSGTTNAPTGDYPLTAYGTVWLHLSSPGVSGFGAFDRDSSFAGDLNRFSPFGGYYVSVINPGDSCHPSSTVGINNFSSSLNSALTVYPNPSNGIFELKLNAGQRVNGNVNVIDATGRIVYTEKLDVIGLYNTTIDLTRFSKGLYTVQLKTAEGIATKNISVE